MQMLIRLFNAANHQTSTQPPSSPHSEVTLYFMMKLMELIASIDLKSWTKSSVLDLILSLLLIVKVGRWVPELVLMKFFFQDTIYLMENFIVMLRQALGVPSENVTSYSTDDDQIATSIQRTRPGKPTHGQVTQKLIAKRERNREKKRARSSYDYRIQTWFVSILCYVVYLFLCTSQLCVSTSLSLLPFLSAPSSQESITIVLDGLCERNSDESGDGSLPTFVVFCYLNAIFFLAMIVLGIMQMIFM
jgi:hypothetical protein